MAAARQTCEKAADGLTYNRLMCAACHCLMQPLSGDGVRLQVASLEGQNFSFFLFFPPVNMAKGRCAFHGFFDGALESQHYWSAVVSLHGILLKLIISHN